MPNETILTGTAYNFDATAYTCSVQPDGALATFLNAVPVSRHLNPSLLPNGARVSLLVFDDNNPTDSMVVGVTTTNWRTPSARVYRNAAQSIPNAAQTAISFTTARHDTMADITPMWTVGDPTRIYARSPGIYIVTASIEFASNATGQRTVAIMDNASNQFIGIVEIQAVNGDTTNITCSSGPFFIATSSSFQVLVTQNSGAALNVDAVAAYTPELAVALVG